MRTVFFVVLIVAATFAFAIPAANADSCDFDTVIFSHNSAVPASLNSHALACDAESDGFGVGYGDLSGSVPADSAVINPGSDTIQIRYIPLTDVDSLTAVVTGLGYDHVSVDLPLTYSSTFGSYTYDSASLPLDPTLSGSITVQVFEGATQLDSVTFHTVA